LDRDGARLLLNEFACAYDRPYFDIATDTHSDGDLVTFGGRLMVRVKLHPILLDHLKRLASAIG